MSEKTRFIKQACTINRCNERGFALAAVLFVLVAIGGMGLTVSMITAGQQVQSSASLKSYRAQYAAMGGIEWAYQKALDMGWSGAGLSGLNGDYNMPDSSSFAITYRAPDLISSSTMDGVTRTVKYANFAAMF